MQAFLLSPVFYIELGFSLAWESVLQVQTHLMKLCAFLPFPFQLFIVIGNKRANDFWAGNLQKEEELHMDSPVEKRKNFITQKYKEGKFRKTLLASLSKEELNKVN